MGKDCVFCKIVKGEIFAEKVYEDDDFLGFLDVKPVTSGHLLFIPKIHYEMMVDMPDKLLSQMIIKTKKIMEKLKKIMGADFVVLSVVGIEIPHFHIHLIPRNHGDGLANFWPTKTYKDGEMKKVGEKIRKGFG